jgi:hypothetical protein
VPENHFGTPDSKLMPAERRSFDPELLLDHTLSEKVPAVKTKEPVNYHLEIVNRADGTILHSHYQRAPIPLQQVGSEIEVGEVTPKYYVIRDVYINAAEQHADRPYRQTLVVDPVTRS